MQHSLNIKNLTFGLSIATRRNLFTLLFWISMLREIVIGQLLELDITQLSST